MLDELIVLFDATLEFPGYRFRTIIGPPLDLQSWPEKVWSHGDEASVQETAATS
jgi:hypothetical protein